MAESDTKYVICLVFSIFASCARLSVQESTNNNNSSIVCGCDARGSVTQDRCDLGTGQCQCHSNYSGTVCQLCSVGFYRSSTNESCSKLCGCNQLGSVSPACDEGGRCTCLSGVEGQTCDLCMEGFHSLGAGLTSGCQVCSCNGHASMCDRVTGMCVDCHDNSEGSRCDQCKVGYYPKVAGGVVLCKQCPCWSGSSDTSCHTDIHGVKCDQCTPGHDGRLCDRCSQGYYHTFNNTCVPCRCRDNNTICDQLTGHCLECVALSPPSPGARLCQLCPEGSLPDPGYPQHCITEDELRHRAAGGGTRSITQSEIATIVCIIVAIAIIILLAVGYVLYCTCRPVLPKSRFPGWSSATQEETATFTEYHNLEMTSVDEFQIQGQLSVVNDNYHSTVNTAGQRV